MANEGHIIIKKGKGGRKGNRNVGNPMGMRQFFMPVDKGSARPAFCYPKKKEYMEEEVRTMERNLESGNVAPERRMEYKMKLGQLSERLDLVKESCENAEKIVAKDPDAWKKRRDELAKEISDGMPTRDDVRKRRVNPHANLRREKQEGLEAKKNEYRIISRALGEESNVGFLQKDK